VKGNNSLGFHRYDTWDRVWKFPQLPNVPTLSNKKVKDGADMVWARGCAYLLKGGGCEFYRYDPVTGWSQPLADAPQGAHAYWKKGSWLAYGGGDYIYALKAMYREFYRYNLNTGLWSTNGELEPMPLEGSAGSKKPGVGGCGAHDYVNNVIYALKGKNQREFWRYSVLNNRWIEVQAIPSGSSGKRVKDGGDIVYAPSLGAFYVLKGNRTNEFWRYVPPSGGGAPGGLHPPASPGPNEVLLGADGDAEDVRWSNSGEWVAFTACDSSGHRQVYQVSASGGQLLQMTSLAGECARPVWSPGDTSLAFEVMLDDSNFSQIAVVPDTGGQVTYLTSSHWDHWHVTWSQAGTVGFLRDDSAGFSQVYTLESTGGEVALTQEPVEHESPEFMSATEIVFVREDANRYTQLYVTEVDWLGETALTSSSRDHSNPAPAVEAGLVFYEVEDANRFLQIAVVPVGGASETVLTSGSYDFESPTVNSDASAIYCTQSSGPGISICLVGSGGGWEQLTDDMAERVTPHVQPSGLSSPSAAYVRDGDVFRLSEGSGKSQQSAGQMPLALSVAEPNPGRDKVTIRWQVSAPSDVSLRVYNAAGQLVKVLADGKTKPGAYTSVWNGTDTKGRRLANGVYFCALDNGSRKVSRKLVLTE
jgi:hypothetical protein